MVQIDAKLVESLLYEEESSELDFKREQYRFIGASDEDKSELLKDILAFANSWRRSGAFILIGVEEIKGGRSSVVGITQDLDDAQLQQFVNSKTQRPISFSYRAVPIDQKRVGVIHVPIQDRPLHLKKDFGKLRKGTVYVRRGSSTDQADPDEIARMGSDTIMLTGPEPRLSISMGDTKKRALLGSEISVDVLNLQTPPKREIPDYSEEKNFYELDAMRRINREYYRQLVEYTRITEQVQGFNVAVTNSGDVIAQGVRAVFEISDDKGILILRRNIPAEPEARYSTLAFALPQLPDLQPDVWVERLEGVWRIEVELGKIQAKDTGWSRDKIYIGAREEGRSSFPVKVFADNLSRPESGEIIVSISAKREDADLARVILINRDRFLQSDEYRQIVRDSNQE